MTDIKKYSSIIPLEIKKKKKIKHVEWVLAIRETGDAGQKAHFFPHIICIRLINSSE